MSKDFLTQFPFMASPLHLMAMHRGDLYLKTPAHLYDLNRRLLEFYRAPGGSWIGVNMPRRCGKTETATIGLSAWSLLGNPDLPILAVGHSEDFAISKIGRPVREIIDRFGPTLGRKIRQDVKAAGEWKMDGAEGGLTCFGPSKGGVGYEAGLYIIDDLIADIEDAFSPGESEKHWRFFMGTIYGLLTNQTKLLVVGTRWSRRDIFGRLTQFAKEIDHPFPIVRYPALAVERDIDPETGKDQLGREIGEPLWPERVSLAHILGAKKRFGPFWNAHYQQSPVEEEDSLLKPHSWPLWQDAGHTYRLTRSLPDGGGEMSRVMKDQIAVMIAVDWAYREKKKADRTAIIVFGLLPDGAIMILNCIAKRFSVEQGPKELARICSEIRQTYGHLSALGMEGHPAMALECRRYPGIPEPMQFKPGSIPKVVRAMGAIEMGNAGRIFLPDEHRPWLDDFRDELGAFTGVDDDHDDQVDALAWACRLATDLRGAGRGCDEPVVLIDAPQRGDLYQ
jgi:predicted phage terminase large subunit-like protein